MKVKHFVNLHKGTTFIKDQSLSRYPEFEVYKANSGLLFPKLFGS